MNRFLYSFMLLSLCLPMANAQGVKHLTLTYDESDFNYSYDTDSCLSIDSETLQFVLGEDTLAPALPYFPLYVLISPDLNYSSKSTTCQDSIVLMNVNIAPNPIPVPTSYNSLETEHRVISYNDSIYPRENIEYRGTQVIAGYKVLSFLVTPYKYHSQCGQLRFANTLDIDINLTRMSPTQEIPTRIGNSMRDFVATLVFNKEEMDSLYPTSPQHGHGLLAPPLGENAKYRYAIITDSSLVEAYRPLAEWKTIKGVRAKIITTQEICSTQSNDTPQLKIKKKLRDLYEEGLEYALLGGNVDLVPAQMCKLPVYDSKNKHSTTPSDLFFSCFDNSLDWNAYSDTIYGEKRDSVDFGPEIVVTRIPLSQSDDVKMFVNRIINYEKGKIIEPMEWKNRILMCGNHVNEFNLYDSQNESEKMYESAILPYNYPRFRFYNTFTDYPEGSSYPITGRNLQAEIEKGYAFWDYAGHGWIHTWGGLEDGSLFDYHCASDIHNKTFTVVTTSCCYSNAFDIIKDGNQIFDDHNRFSIALIKNPNSGVIAYYGSSREGWYPNYSNNYSTHFYQNLFNGTCSNFGKLAQLSKSELLSKIDDDVCFRALQFSINPLGDPEMPIRTSTPKTFNSVNITSLGEDSINVNANIDSCIICVMSANDNGLTFYDADTLKHKSYPFAADTMSICITKDNYIPAIYKYVKGDNLYIQNETMQGNNHVRGDYIMVGSNVTTEKEEGPVSIENGSTILESANGVTITRDFEVREGAEFEIKISN